VAAVALLLYALVLGTLRSAAGIRIGFPILLVAIGSGLFGLVNAAVAVFRRGERSRVGTGCLVLGGLFALLIVTFVVADILGGTHTRRLTVEASITGGRIELTGNYDSTDSNRPLRLVFEVTNREGEAQRVGILELRPRDLVGHTAVQLQANRYPLVEGQVRHYSFPGEGEVVFWATGEPVSLEVAHGAAAPPRPADLSVELQPGASARISLSEDFSPGALFVVFSDLPGRYAASQWATLVTR